MSSVKRWLCVMLEVGKLAIVLKPVTDDRPKSMWRYSTPTFQLPANAFEMPAPALQPTLTSDLLPAKETFTQLCPPGVQKRADAAVGVAVGQTTGAVG